MYLSEQRGYQPQPIVFGDHRDRPAPRTPRDPNAISPWAGVGGLLFALAYFATCIAGTYVGFIIVRGAFRWALKQ